MRTELYSVRSSAEEIAYISQNKLALVQQLDELCSIRVLFKTEIDSNPRKLKNEFLDSFNSDNPPEFYIFVNASDTKDSGSFRRLFTPLVHLAEKELAAEFEEEQEGKELHLLITPIDDIGEEYPAYCFKIHTKKLLVLPRKKFVKQDYLEYTTKAINRAKEIFLEKQTEAPYGYIITDGTKKLSDATSPLPLVSEEAAPLNTEPKLTAAQALKASAVESAEAEEEKTEEIADSELVNISPVAETPEDIDISSSPLSDMTDDDKERTPTNIETPDTTNDEKTDTEATPAEKGGKTKRFVKSFIPCKGDSVKNIILKIVVLIAILGFLVGAYLLIDFYLISPSVNKATMSEIQKLAYSTNIVTTDTEGNIISMENGSINWEALKEVNEEIVGWIRVSNSEIDYPVLYHEGDSADSQYYIYKDYNKKPSDFGSIFVDYRCLESVNSRHVILHGHNMGVDKSMFGSLTSYASNVDYYKSAPIVEFDTPEVEGDWLIFSVMKIDVSNDKDDIFNYLLGEFDSDAQFMNFIYNLKERSYLNIDVPINETDRILTLSTCSYEGDNMRTVVVARQLREGEDPQSYIDSAEKHSPKSTVSSTFRTELEADNITWYDGSGELEGNEEIPVMLQSEMFTVKFLDANNKVISTQYVIKGKDATPPESNPRKAAADGYYYTFKKWDTSYKNVTKDLTIKPVFTKHKLTIVTEPTTTVTTEVEIEGGFVTPETPVTPATPATTAPQESATTEANVTEATSAETASSQGETEAATEAP